MTEAYSTEERIKASQLELDLRVNPRSGNETWIRGRLGDRNRDGSFPGYKPNLLGQLVVSYRETEDGPKYIVLDGANRLGILQAVGDMDREVSCEVWHGFTLQEEAAHAKGLNDRRGWSPVRKFQTNVTAGEPEAVRIMETLQMHGWTVAVAKGYGVLTGVASLQKLIRTAEKLAGLEAEGQGAKKGTEQYRAAITSGRDRGQRVLDEALQVVTQAWPEKDSAYTGDITYGVGLILLRDERLVELATLSDQLMRYQGGKLTLVTNAKAYKQVQPSFKVPDGIAQIIIQLYNKSFNSRSSKRLEEVWKAIAV